jgi:hypothetical protein
MSLDNIQELQRKNLAIDVAILFSCLTFFQWSHI